MTFLTSFPECISLPNSYQQPVVCKDKFLQNDTTGDDLETILNKDKEWKVIKCHLSLLSLSLFRDSCLFEHAGMQYTSVRFSRKVTESHQGSIEKSSCAR